MSSPAAASFALASVFELKKIILDSESIRRFLKDSGLSCESIGTAIAPAITIPKYEAHHSFLFSENIAILSALFIPVFIRQDAMAFASEANAP